MRGPGFLRFNEQKKTQSTNPLTLAISPGGERGQPQKFDESQVAATGSEFRAFAVRIRLTAQTIRVADCSGTVELRRAETE